MPLGTEVGRSPGDIMLDGDPASPSPLQKRGSPHKKGTAPAQFSAHVYCGQMAGWMKTPLGMEVDLSPGHILLDSSQLTPAKGAQYPPVFGQCLLWPRSPILATAELNIT